MQVIPAINELTVDKVIRKAETAASLFDALPIEYKDLERWVHIDVADGKFTEHKTWDNPTELKKLLDRKSDLGLKIEIHLMVEKPEEVLGRWLQDGVDRVITHVETMQESKGSCLCGSTVVLAINPETSAEKLLECGQCAAQVLLLGVKPGPSGQAFNEDILDKISLLKERLTDTKIQVDGGMNKENARRAKERGADVIVTASYLWGSEDPAKTLLELIEL